MKSLALPFALLLALVPYAALAPQDPPQDPPPQKQPNPPGNQGAPKANQPSTPAGKALSPAEEWQRRLQFSMPGRHHMRLNADTGLWNVTLKFMPPGQPTQTSSAKSDIRGILAGRFIVEDLKGELGGRAYEGYGVLGYDEEFGHYVGLWMDTEGTKVHLSLGTRNEDGTLVMSGTKRDAIDGVEHPFRTEISPGKDADGKVDAVPKTMTKRVYDTIDGKEVLLLEMLYERRK